MYVVSTGCASYIDGAPNDVNFDGFSFPPSIVIFIYLFFLSHGQGISLSLISFLYHFVDRYANSIYTSAVGGVLTDGKLPASNYTATGECGVKVRNFVNGKVNKEQRKRGRNEIQRPSSLRHRTRCRRPRQ